MKKKTKSNKGTVLVIIVILILLGTEAFAYLLNSRFQPDELPKQYFRLMLTIPVIIYFYLGYTWALWLIRIGLVLGIVASIFLTTVLIDMTDRNTLIALSGFPIVGNIFGTWIVFSSQRFKSYIRRKRRARGIYE
ncbi:MAG: hypothetical protein ACSHX8_05560 [Opitutaceae bacterium]